MEDIQVRTEEAKNILQLIRKEKLLCLKNLYVFLALNSMVIDVL